MFSGAIRTCGSKLPFFPPALSEAIKDREGYLSKVCNLLPVRILSYIMLPCSLPVESAIAAVHR